MSFDAAIRENRQGNILISEDLLVDFGVELETLISSCMLVVERSHSETTRHVILSGYSMKFDSLELGERAPQYLTIFSRTGIVGTKHCIHLDLIRAPG